jgi:tetratricopeptide (TPR) repeat protein
VHMWRNVGLAFALLVLLLNSAVAQRVDEHPPSQNQTTTNPQPVPLPDDARVPDASSSGATPEKDQQQKKGSKVTRQMKKALPDCINIIFSICPGNRVRQDEANEADEARLARAAERCRQLKAARPSPAPATPSQVPAGESSSKTAMPADVSPMQCTPEDVLAAEHDVEVGDFNFSERNYRGAEMRYRSALERLPGDPIATLHLARVLEKQGKKPEALQQYQAFMTWSPVGKDAEEANAAIARLRH